MHVDVLETISLWHLVRRSNGQNFCSPPFKLLKSFVLLTNARSVAVTLILHHKMIERWQVGLHFEVVQGNHPGHSCNDLWVVELNYMFELLPHHAPPLYVTGIELPTFQTTHLAMCISETTADFQDNHGLSPFSSKATLQWMYWSLIAKTWCTQYECGQTKTQKMEVHFLCCLPAVISLQVTWAQVAYYHSSKLLIIIGSKY